MRSLRRVAVVGLVAYLFSAAFLPPGHMAASLASGGPFHLCPGDARSGLILTALARADAAPSADHSAGHHSDGGPTHHVHGVGSAGSMIDPGDAGPSDAASPHGDAAGAAEPRFDSNCSAATPGLAVVASMQDALGDLQQGRRAEAPSPEGPITPARWLRPAPRSPPA